MGRLLLTSFVLTFVIMILCQAVITLRVWYLFPRSKPVRFFAVSMYASCTIGTGLAGILLYTTISNELQDVDMERSPSLVWIIFLPSLIIHSVLFALKIYRFLNSSSYLQNGTLLHRFMKEGGLMYAFATSSLLFTIISLAMTDISNLRHHSQGDFDSAAVMTTVVSVCRAMLSIRSLAATWHVEPSWLLGHAELSRVQWTRGTEEGIILVEINSPNSEIPPRLPMQSYDQLGTGRYSSHSSSKVMTVD
ncbi:hypothetical protein BJ138DRAFT_1001559 [Hygrophoropsis aurantiaca]|uniref:Uncharacterized protein n=1 Tax=Hygrophoropsis aurantiaca TaxID=72124 RepID=A0ACB8AJT8_9AGAM|nr:hypothetical protein BJ138DRAFT_1001559 [Hygrophoropsis aurantiaca]